jgi:hypothetical protein
MHIEGRQLLTWRDDSLDAIECAKHRNQRRGGLQQDPSGPFGHQGRVATELQRVTQALLAVEQDGPAAQIGSIPGWLRNFQVWCCEPRPPPTPLEFSKTRPVIALQKVQTPEIETRFREVGFERDGVLQRRERAVSVTLLAQTYSLPAQRLRVAVVRRVRCLQWPKRKEKRSGWAAPPM